MSRLKGQEAERLACQYLRAQGYTILEQNFYAKKLGEIDIIATKNSVYHFIEVKSSDDYETAVNNITPSKLSKLYRSIEYYIQNKQIDPDYVLDAIIVINKKITHLENLSI